jgi:hypothetical protein
VILLTAIMKPPNNGGAITTRVSSSSSSADVDDDDSTNSLDATPLQGTLSPPHPPKKYSRDYFEQRIQTLTKTLQQQLPVFDPLELDTFVTSCQSYQQAKISWTSAQTLVQALVQAQQQAKKTHKDDPTNWDDLIERAQSAATAAWNVVEDTLQVCSKTARPLLQQIQKQQQEQQRPQRNQHACVMRRGKLQKEEQSGSSLVTSSSVASNTIVDEATLLECTVLVRGGGSQAWADWCALSKQPCTDTTTTTTTTNNNSNNRENGPLLDDFFTNLDWMKEWFRAGGPSHGNFGAALNIYDKILASSPPPPSVTCLSLPSFLSLDNNNDASTSSTFTTRRSTTHKNKHVVDGDKVMRLKLAGAASLQLATPVAHFHSTTSFVDPVARYWHYVQAYERGELDPIVSQLSEFELRYMMDCDASDQELQWGRDYLTAYRPDQILTEDTQWRYVHTVSTDVGYKQPDLPFDTYADMISSGGECGPRAFFGRFILKAFGIPTWGVRQPGHAALSHYTNDRGWLMCYGAAWKWSTWNDDRYCGPKKVNETRSGPDWYEETQARLKVAEKADDGDDENDLYYQQVTQLECIADILGETVEEEVNPKKVWRSLALMQRKLLAESPSSNSQLKLQPKQPEAVPPPGFQLLGSSTTKRSTTCAEIITTSTQSTHSSITMAGGQIIIPAASFSSPAQPNKNVLSMLSFLGGSGGTQLHLEADGTVEYILPASESIFPTPRASYMLTCRYVTIHRVQVPLLLTIEFAMSDKEQEVTTINNNHKDDNDGQVDPDNDCPDDDVDADDDDDDVISLDDTNVIVDLYSIPLEYTVGTWKTTLPIKVEVGPKATLKFSREPPNHGVSIKDFTLQPC